MKIPVLLIGASLLFWGNETDNLAIGLVLCLLFEGSHLIKIRYNLSEDDFVKISDLTSLVFLGSVALVLLNYQPLGFLRITAGWLPLILSPLMLAQLYSAGDKIIIGTRLGKRKKAYTHKPMDFRFYYLMVCLFSSATGNSRSLWFFPVMGLLIFSFLFFNRGRSYSPVFFISLIFITFGFGYGSVEVMERGHRYVMQKSFRFWHQYYRDQHGDPYKSHVNFGDTGRMKLSGEIIMRIDSFSDPPRLFKEASFTTYRRGDWFGNLGDFQYLAPLTGGGWNLIEPPQHQGTMGQGNKAEVELNLPREKGLLPVPHGAYRISSGTIFELEQNRFGTVKIVDGAEIVSYDVDSKPKVQKNDDKPRADSLDVPDRERYALEMVVKGLNHTDFSDSEKIDALSDYFDNGFSYSPSLVGKGEYETALENFLLHRKSGFCEYYATATSLLLREMGIPSRYAIGYAVTEKSSLEGRYIVRKRHAHAWAEAFVDEQWVVVDTTPPDWLMVDGKRASVFEPVRDLFSFLRHKYKLFRIGTGKDYTLLFSVIIVILTTYLVFRIYRRMKIEQARDGEDDNKIRSFIPVTSPFSRIIAMLEQSDTPKEENESFVQWAERTAVWNEFDGYEFDRLYRLHLQLRYDPEGLKGDEIVFLEEGVRRWIKGHGNKNLSA